MVAAGVLLNGGRRFAMEAHFVHAAADGDVAGIGVLIVPGTGNTAFSTIVSTMPRRKPRPRLLAARSTPINCCR